MDKITLDKNLVVAIVNYLAARPYNEVHQFVGTLVPALQEAAKREEALQS